MHRPLPLFIGLRYTGAKRRNHFISFISLISMVGIALGVAALIVVISVMNGFEKELHTRILGMVSHATVYGTGRGLEDWPYAMDLAERHPLVRGAAPFIQREAMTAKGKQVSGALIRGVLPTLEPKVSQVDAHMAAGRLASLRGGAFNIVIGAELARYLDVGLGDKITLVSPQVIATPAGILPRHKRFTVTGVFEIGMHQYDRGMALIHLDDAAKLFRMGDRVTGVRLDLEDMGRAREAAREIALDLPGLYAIKDWTQEHANFFKAVATEKTAMFVILSMIVGVAAFNIVATLVMAVTDKQADIAILRTLGATPGTIMGIFIVQGTLIGLIGTALGVGAGAAVAVHVPDIVPALERVFGVEFLPSDVYYISDLPSELLLSDVIRIAALGFGLSVLATLYPARRAAKTQPAEALRYE